MINETINNILARESCREFSKKNIPKETLEILFDCAKKAPRSQGSEFIEIFFVRSKKIVEKIFWFCPGMANLPQSIVILGVNYKKLENDSSYYPYLELGASLQNILLSAFSLGIGSVPVGSSNLSGIHELLEIPDNINLKILISLGYQDTNKNLKVNLNSYNKIRSYKLL